MSKMYEALRKAQEQGSSIEIPVPLVREDSQSLPVALEESEAPNESACLVSRHEDGSGTGNGDGNGNGNGNGHGVRILAAQPSANARVLQSVVSNSPGVEQYRIIRTRIVQHPARPKIIVVSSAGAGDGKTVSAVNLAGVLSLRDDANVLLIDADLRRADVSSILGLPSEPGLANTLEGSCTLQEAIVQVEQFPNLYVLPAGASDRNPAELLDSERWRSLCSIVRENFNFALIDAPPIAAVADYELIQANCDGVIMVVRPDHTDRTLCNKAFELIPKKKRLGVVLNCAYEWFLWKTHESHYYGKGVK
jgi:capsular exopolysaccharide synthesis family protein